MGNGLACACVVATAQIVAPEIIAIRFHWFIGFLANTSAAYLVSPGDGGTPVHGNPLHAFQRVFEQIPRADQGEAQIIPAAGTKRCARDSCYSALFEHNRLYFLCGKPRLFDIDPGVKRALRRLATESGNAVQPGDEKFSPLAI